MRERSSAWVAIALSAIVVAAHEVSATMFAMLNEQELTQQAEVVATGRVVSVQALPDARSGGVLTEVVIQPDTMLIGSAPSGAVVLHEIGGEIANRSEHIYGGAEYHPGERVLVFADRNNDGSLRTASLALGKYTIRNLDGHDTATRDLGDGVAVLDPRSAELTYNPAPGVYDLDALLTSIRGAAAAQVTDPAPALTPSADDLGDFTAPFTYLGSPYRWFEPDTGLPVAYSIDTTGDTAIGPQASQTAVANALAAWTNVVTSDLVLEPGDPVGPAPFAGCPTTSHVVFNDPYNEVSDPVNCGGILGVGGYCGSGETRVVSGTTFHRISVAKVVFNNGWGGCYGWNACNLAEVATHEIGHTIGFGHSQDSGATMAAYAHFDGRCAGLRSDDIAAVSTAYPTSDPVHDAVAVPLPPVQLKISPKKSAIAKSISLKVRNGDFYGAGHEIKLTVADGSCPSGTAGLPNFGTAAASAPDTVWLGPGKTKSATVPLSVSADSFQTPDGKTPHRCTLQVSVQSLFPGNTDPAPENDSFPLELNLIDGSDLGRVASPGVHQSFIQSVAPIVVKIAPGSGQVIKRVKVHVGNGDSGEIPGHVITIAAQSGDCPAGMLGIVQFDGSDTPNQVLVRGGKKPAGVLQLNVDADQFSTPQKTSPARCTAQLTVSGPDGDADASNDSTQLVIDVVDKNDM